MTLTVRGVVPPLITPLTPQGNLDGGSLKALVGEQLRAGVDGLFVGGSTGEVALADDQLRQQALQTVVEQASGEVPVLAGAIDTGTRRVIAHALRARDAGAAAVVVTPPFYIAPNEAEIARHYEQVANAVDVPVIAYDIPAATHVSLPLAAVRQLVSDGTIAAVKDSSGDITRFRQILELTANSPVTVLTGSETVADLALQLGADGIVPGLGNVDPAGYVRIQRDCDAGDWPAAAREQRRLIKLFGIITIADRRRIGFTAGALGSFKTALWLRGVIDHPGTLAPLSPLSDAEVDTIRGTLTAAGLSVVR